MRHLSNALGRMHLNVLRVKILRFLRKILPCIMFVKTASKQFTRVSMVSWYVSTLQSNYQAMRLAISRDWKFLRIETPADSINDVLEKEKDDAIGCIGKCLKDSMVILSHVDCDKYCKCYNGIPFFISAQKVCIALIVTDLYLAMDNQM